MSQPRTTESSILHKSSPFLKAQLVEHWSVLSVRTVLYKYLGILSEVSECVWIDWFDMRKTDESIQAVTHFDHFWMNVSLISFSDISSVKFCPTI